MEDIKLNILVHINAHLTSCNKNGFSYSTFPLISFPKIHSIDLFRIPGMATPFYIHTPTSYIYDNPAVAVTPLGVYQWQTGMLNMYPNFFASQVGMEYRSLPPQVPYSQAALAAQGGKYPPTSMSVPNDWVYPIQTQYPAIEYPRYPGGGYYGQRGMLPAPIT